MNENLKNWGGAILITIVICVCVYFSWFPFQEYFGHNLDTYTLFPVGWGTLLILAAGIIYPSGSFWTSELVNFIVVPLLVGAVFALSMIFFPPPWW
ncbi:hypothetical protein HN954_00260 [bacterium]|jgi:hypothetical protein|nr:hypothetical protein [bacterium]MBT6832068.1 hypothetical protein [bacterium]MBT6995849.1 hypothetical protein [bacterium]MBT7772340.1 hypothetical protein [bacterium]